MTVPKTPDISYIAETLGSLPVTQKRNARDVMTKKAAELRRNIINKYRTTYRNAIRGESLSMCEELFLDEFYTIEKQLTLLSRALSDRGERCLPCYISGLRADTPRIAAVAKELTKIRCAKVNAQAVIEFIELLQQKQALEHAELCLLPVALKLALITLMHDTIKGACSGDTHIFMQNILISLRTLDEEPWDEIIRGLSRLEALLGRDPNYALLDKESRAYCVRNARRIARRLKLPETEVARQAAELALGGEGRTAHVGYYIAAEGMTALYRTLRPNIKRLPLNVNEVQATLLSTIALLTLAMLSLIAISGIAEMLLSIFPVLTVAASVALTIFGKMFYPRAVLRLDIASSAGEHSTTVAMPVLLATTQAVVEALGTLETHYIANSVDGVRFVLLGDLADSDVPEKENDKDIVDEAVKGIEELNKRYGDRFTFLCRKRAMNPDGAYQGHERKRGAVMELCGLLLGETNTFWSAYPNADIRSSYVVILDGDTVMPHGALQKLIGAAAHPINTPECDIRGNVACGYTIIAPNMKATSRSAAKTYFARLVSGDAGAALYSINVSNFHMDAFSEGDFGGKGIINVGSFYNLLKNTIPDNTVLSHDLLEGCITRAAFMDDVTLYDTEPSTLEKWWKRQHRWIRGDWQLLPFIVGKLRHDVPQGYSRIKMLGNILRSLREPVTALLMLISFLFDMPTLLAVTIIAYAFEPIKGFALLILTSIKERADSYQWKLLMQRTLMEFITLPYAAYQATNAIITTLVRLLITHKGILIWQTASNNSASDSVAAYYRKMAAQPIMAILILAVCAVGDLFLYGDARGSMWVSATVLALLWIIAPPIIRSIDKNRKQYQLNDEEKAELLTLFSATWRFFSDLCNENTSYLPPDNVQEKPLKPPVGITSPTNIGMGLLAVVSARDAGFATDEQMLDILGKMLNSIDKAEKWHGNLYNWYRLSDLTPVRPRFVSSVDSGNLVASLMVTSSALRELTSNVDAATRLAGICDRLVVDTDLSALFDKKRKLFYIGYEYEEGRYTQSWYDLYASEARLTGYVAIALGQISPLHWRQLSRVMTEACGGKTLLSWSGTAFEYLMPLLFMETVDGSLQHEICQSAIRTQILKGTKDKPWGVSESGYYCFDRAMYYQYRAFGIPELGLEPRYERTDVIAPYATALALRLEPEHAIDNIRLLKRIGAAGEYGMYEALDYSSSEMGNFEIVRSFMAHHQGMSLCAYNELLNNGAISKRFMSIPCVRAYETLLFETMPTKPIVIHEYESSVYMEYRGRHDEINDARIAAPQKVIDGQLLSNGEYSVQVFADGSCISKCKDIALTARHAKGIGSKANDGGNLGGIELLFKSGGKVWKCDREVCFEPHKVTFRGGNGGVEARYSIIVAADTDAEIRTITLINRGRESENVRTGIFLEPVMTPVREYRAHPAFVKLSVEAIQTEDCTLYSIRKKANRNQYYLYSAIVSPTQFSFATDAYTSPKRLSSPQDAMNRPFDENICESPIEPYWTGMGDMVIAAGESVQISYIMGLAASAQDAVNAVKELRTRLEREETLARAMTKGIMKSAGITEREAMETEPLIARLSLGIPYKPYSTANCNLDITDIWGFGISGDNPIMLVKVYSQEQLGAIKKLVQVAMYAERRGAAFDIIVMGMYPNEYGSRIRSRLAELVRYASNIQLIDAYSITEEQLCLLESVALICCEADSIPYAQITIPSRAIGKRDYRSASFTPPIKRELTFYNGYGGFDVKNQEYVIYVGSTPTPAPWSNIIANEGFGTLVTENGGGFTWYANSRLNRITPWYNDPYRDPCGERITMRDEETGVEFTLTPNGGNGEYEAAHGIGYTKFSCEAEGLRAELTEMADAYLPVKYFQINVKNEKLKRRAISVSLEVEWALGEQVYSEAILSRTEQGIVMARSARQAFDGKYSFIACGEADITDDIIDGDTQIRRGVARLTKRIELGEGEGRDIVMLLGKDSAENIKRYNAELTNHAAFSNALKLVSSVWNERLCRLEVATGDPAFDILVNRILLYQTYSSRLFAKTGYYQSGGATGFRDQLQDIASILMTDPERAKRQILLAASKQFEKGDALHWWHDDGKGVRTRITDDRLFLPYTVMKYVEVTGDSAIWRDMAPFLQDIPIPEGAKDLYQSFENDGEGTILAHCIAAIEASLEFGAHGLPLMGGGDWNDGMDNVGEDGGESVFLGWFLLYVMERFIPVCQNNGLSDKAENYRNIAEKLRSDIEGCAWEDEWYLRAFYGDGTKLGSAQNRECAIDCVAQCWAVFCNAKHSREAFFALCHKLVDTRNGLIRLLTPPFTNTSSKNAGYIEAYTAGVRENGGQYTHAAAWAIIAACSLGEAERAQQFFKLINPIEHGATLEINRYRAEPYVVAGDVYSVDKNAGRGGWTWYTGAAGWLYTAAVEHILGVKKYGTRLYIKPVTVFSRFTVTYKYMDSVYKIRAEKGGEYKMLYDGKSVLYAELVNDGAAHSIEVTYP